MVHFLNGVFGAATSVALLSAGITINTWQWWAVMLTLWTCMVVNRLY